MGTPTADFWEVAEMSDTHCPACGSKVITRTLEKHTMDGGRELVEVPHRCSSSDCLYRDSPFPYGSFLPGEAGQ